MGVVRHIARNEAVKQDVGDVVDARFEELARIFVTEIEHLVEDWFRYKVEHLHADDGDHRLARLDVPEAARRDAALDDAYERVPTWSAKRLQGSEDELGYALRAAEDVLENQAIRTVQQPSD